MPHSALEIKDITPETAYELVTLGLAEIIDIREAWELASGKRVEGATHIPLLPVKSFCNALDAEDLEMMQLIDDSEISIPVSELVRMLNTHRERGSLLLCLCRSGRRSLKASQMLKSLGYKHVFNIKGGILEWEEKGLPVLDSSTP
jgi:rhodanese-related sulfurtransferase